MFKKTMTAVGLVLLVATPAMAVEGPFPVRDIEGTATFESDMNPNALQFYPDVAKDVEAAAREASPRAADDSSRPLDVKINITALRLNDNPVLTDDGNFNVMEGVVTVYDAMRPEAGPIKTDSVLVSAEQMQTAMPSFSPDNRDYYNAMVAAFADRAVKIAGDVTTLPDIPNVTKN